MKEVNPKDEVIDQGTIDTDQAFELQELAKASNQDLVKICKIHNIETIIQLPLAKFEALKIKLGQKQTAIDLLQKATSLAPSNKEIAKHLKEATTN